MSGRGAAGAAQETCSGQGVLAGNLTRGECFHVSPPSQVQRFGVGKVKTRAHCTTRLRKLPASPSLRAECASSPVLPTMLRGASAAGLSAAASLRAISANLPAAGTLKGCSWARRACSTSTAAAADGSPAFGSEAGAGDTMDAQTQVQAKAVLSRQLDAMASLAHKWESASDAARAGLAAELERMAPQWRSLATFLHQGDSELADAFLAQYERLERLRVLASREGDLPLRASLWSEGGDNKDTVPPHPYMSNVVYDSQYYTSEDDPLAHTAEHDGKYFPLDARVDMHQLMPEGPPGDLGTEFALSGHVALMLRPHMRELVRALDAFKHASQDTVDTVTGALQQWPTGVAEPPPASTQPSLPLDYNAESGAVEAGVAVGGDARGVAAKDLPFRLLTGPRGIGKSATLAYALYYARRNGWITVFVPDCFAWFRQALYHVPSTSRPGWADQPDMALETLKHIKDVNAHLLADVPQRGSYPRDKYLPLAADEEVMAAKAALRKEEDGEKARRKAAAEAAGEAWDPSTFTSNLPQLLKAEDVDRSGATLADMVEWGVRHPPFATDCLLDLVAELRQTHEHPVLLAVDGVNWCYEPSDIKLYGQTVPMEQVSLASLGRVLGPDGVTPSGTFKRGFTLVADSYRNSFHTSMYEQVRSPRGTRLAVPPLDRPALHSQLLHYHYSGNFFEVQDRQDVDSHAVDYFRTISAGNPREVMRAAALVADQQASTIGQRKKPRL